MTSSSQSAERAPADPSDDQGHTPFEDVMAKLTSNVERLEGGDLSLEESLRVFEEGVRLSREGQRRLDEAERRIEALLTNGDTRPLGPPEHDD